MYLVNLTDIVASLAAITTIIQFLSGTVICKQYISKKSTGETSGFPFICGFLSCVLWLKYGLLTDEHSVILVNSVGAILFLSYVIIYYIFTINKSLTLRQFSVICLVMVSVMSYTTYEDEIEKAAKTIGIICCIVTIIFVAAPFTLLMHVIKVRNTECLPFPLIFTSFLVSLLWFCYGLLISDSFIQITNFVGVVISISQLSLFVIYPKRSHSEPSYQPVVQNIF